MAENDIPVTCGCGTTYNEADEHVCDVIPAKGEMIKKGTNVKVPNPQSDLNK